MIVTYNGLAFDLPLLHSRYTISRQESWATSLWQLDLLTQSRRFYRRSLESCRLKDIERDILGVQRGADIAGWRVPAVYFDFVRYGTPGLMPAVIRHNALDVLSLVTLLSHLSRLVEGHPPTMSSEALELAEIARRSGEADSADIFLERALALATTPQARLAVLERRLRLLKRAGRWAEVRDLCLRHLGEHGPTDPFLCIEGAKACEHRTGQLDTALSLTERALLRLEMRSHHESLKGELQHRRGRLLRKIARRIWSHEGPKEGPP